MNDGDADGSTPSRRHRRRPATTGGPSKVGSPTAAGGATATGRQATQQPPVPSNKGPAARAGGPARRRDRDSGGGLRDLVGGGPSYLGVGGALRGRDVNRPTDEDLAEAEQNLVIVRRNWRPDTTG